MELFIFWIVFSIAIGILASNRGRSGFGWFVFSVFLSPLFGLLFVLVTKNLADGKESKEPQPVTHVRCPDCRELVLRDARKCRHCGCTLIPQ